MVRADYTAEIIEVAGRKVLTLHDLNLGRMSVTNNMEEIVAHELDKRRLTTDQVKHTLAFNSNELYDVFDNKAERWPVCDANRKDCIKWLEAV